MRKPMPFKPMPRKPDREVNPKTEQPKHANRGPEPFPPVGPLHGKTPPPPPMPHAKKGKGAMGGKKRGK